MTDRNALPPLNALRAFDAVMRARSFRGAADDLRVSPQAVSQQVRHLESVLGLPLFERRGRAAEPTEAALLLGHYVASGFEEMAEGIRRVTAPRRTRITLNASPYFATRYLLPRLAGFRDIAPSADIRLTTMVELPDFDRDEVDVAVQWGFGSWPGHESHLLIRDPKVIAARPSVAAAIRRPDDLQHAPLLHTMAAPEMWARVLRHLGVDLSAGAGGVSFQDAETMRRATLAGLGVGLLSRADALDDIRSGLLVAPLGIDALSGMAPTDVPAFSLVLPRAHRRRPMIALLCDWITAQEWSKDIPLP
ncbi:MULTISPECIES: LysR substrate-binding domain-containing protein [unclassified Haematobacter]|uniref:LysR substrate-binding domain-containing protein n=1 Tax=unclassified Haematobacter TaxID=2640585 RepID=UPI0025C5AC7B|nr:MULTISPECIES: LysR substrate-binding domain-containing protein [unclassified Haematobacter]